MTLDRAEDWVYTEVIPTQHIEMLNKSKWQQLSPYWAWKIGRENLPALENKKELAAVPDAAQTPDVVKPHIQPRKGDRGLNAGAGEPGDYLMGGSWHPGDFSESGASNSHTMENCQLKARNNDEKAWYFSRTLCRKIKYCQLETENPNISSLSFILQILNFFLLYVNPQVSKLNEK